MKAQLGHISIIPQETIPGTNHNRTGGRRLFPGAALQPTSEVITTTDANNGAEPETSHQAGRAPPLESRHLTLGFGAITSREQNGDSHTQRKQRQ